MDSLSLTDVAAWWGAIVATAVLGWDVYKWRRRGAEIRVYASPDMQAMPPLPSAPDATFIFVSVTNHGGQATTITNLAGVHYKSIFHALFDRASARFVVGNVPFGPPLPHRLEPGDRWTGGINQDEAVANYGKTGRYYCGVFHAMSQKPAFVRVRLP